MSASEGFDTVLDWLGKMQQERAALLQEVADLKAQLDALLSGADVRVVIAGSPFYLTPNTPVSPGVAIHVVPALDPAQIAVSTTVTGLEHSFLLGDTDEHPIFTEKAS